MKISNQLRLFLVAGALCSLTVGCTPSRAQEPPRQSGHVVIPARGLFSLQEGTVEYWVKFDFDPAKEVQEYTLRGQLMQFIIPKSETDLGASFSITFFQTRAEQRSTTGGVGKTSCLMRAAFVIDGKQVPHPLSRDCTDWKRGQWHHVAVTWRDGQHLTIYFDGKEVGKITYPYSVVRDVPATARLVLGSDNTEQPNGLMMDDLRISSIAREPGTLGQQSASLQADPFTLLLLSFNNTEPGQKDGSLLVRPAVVAVADAPQTYVATRGRIVDGKSGQALAFSPQAWP